MDQVIFEQVTTIGELLKLVGVAERETEVAVNGIACMNPEQELHPGDQIALLEEERGTQPDPLQAPESQDGQKGPGLHIQLNGRTCLLPFREEGYQLFHLLNYVDIDPQNPQGDIVLLQNEKAVSYLDLIHDGDRVEIHWSQEDAFERPPRIPGIL